MKEKDSSCLGLVFTACSVLGRFKYVFRHTCQYGQCLKTLSVLVYWQCLKTLSVLAYGQCLKILSVLAWAMSKDPVSIGSV